MSYLIKPDGYKPILDLKQTELAIKQIKEFFQQNLSTELRLRRVTAPLFVLQGLGINDDLNGVERAVTFPIKDLADARGRNDDLFSFQNTIRIGHTADVFAHGVGHRGNECRGFTLHRSDNTDHFSSPL